MSVQTTSTKSEVITGEALFAMGDIGPGELVEGRIVPLSPTGDEHGGVELNIGAILRAFVRAHQLGKVRVGEVGIYTRRNPDTVRGADVLYISNKRYARRRSMGFLDVAPELIVEVLSPSDSWDKVKDKLAEYFAIDVRLVWVVDPKNRIVHVYRSLTDVHQFTENETLTGGEILPGFSVEIAAFFED